MVYYCFTNIITNLSSGTPMLIHPELTFRGSLSIRLDIAAWSSTSHLTKSLCVYVNTRNHNSIDRRWPASGKVDSQRWTVWPSLTSAASPSFPTRIANWHPKLRVSQAMSVFFLVFNLQRFSGRCVEGDPYLAKLVLQLIQTHIWSYGYVTLQPTYTTYLVDFCLAI